MKTKDYAVERKMVQKQFLVRIWLLTHDNLMFYNKNKTLIRFRFGITEEKDYYCVVMTQ